MKAKSTTTIPAFSILGPPGCGKGTQAKLIQERLGYVHVSSGDIFRHAIAREDPNALKVQDLMKRGELVPDEIIKDMVEKELSELIEQNKNLHGFILDGFPRTVGQAELLDSIAEDLNLRFIGMVNLNVPEPVLIERLLERGKGAEQRPDDNEEVIRARMKVYDDKTFPLISYFTKRNQLVNVDGVGDVEEIYNRLVPILEDLEKHPLMA
ncbi:MAG: adenylate kinase [bacterium]